MIWSFFEPILLATLKILTDLKRKKSKKPTQKIPEIFNPPILNFFLTKFQELVLGLNKLMQRILMWPNLFGCQSVQHKDNLLLKMHFFDFSALL